MRLVVDSSVVLKWFVDEPFREQAAALLDGEDTLVAPDFLLAEVTNALWRKARRAEVTPSQIERAIDEIASVVLLRPINLELTQAAFAIARELEHSIYDCLFLACANEEDAELVTADTKFATKVAVSAHSKTLRLLSS